MEPSFCYCRGWGWEPRAVSGRKCPFEQSSRGRSPMVNLKPAEVLTMTYDILWIVAAIFFSGLVAGLLL
jgi:hypothetical protein